MPEAYYSALGFVPLGPRAFRIDIAERLLGLLKRRAKAGPFAIDADIGALASCPRRELVLVLGALGYVAQDADGDQSLYAEAPRRRRRRPGRAEPPTRHVTVDPHSPFAKLAALRRPRVAR